MTVWLDGETGREYNEDKRLEPMLQIFQQTDWKEQVKSWSEQFGEETVYEILYYGKRAFPSREGPVSYTHLLKKTGEEKGIH